MFSTLCNRRYIAGGFKLWDISTIQGKAKQQSEFDTKVGFFLIYKKSPFEKVKRFTSQENIVLVKALRTHYSKNTEEIYSTNKIM